VCISKILYISLYYISRNTEKRSPGLTDRLRARKNVATARLIKRISTPLLGSPYQVCRIKICSFSKKRSFFFKLVRTILIRCFYFSFSKTMILYFYENDPSFVYRSFFSEQHLFPRQNVVCSKKKMPMEPGILTC